MVVLSPGGGGGQNFERCKTQSYLLQSNTIPAKEGLTKRDQDPRSAAHHQQRATSEELPPETLVAKRRPVRGAHTHTDTRTQRRAHTGLSWQWQHEHRSTSIAQHNSPSFHPHKHVLTAMRLSSFSSRSFMSTTSSQPVCSP